MLSVLNHGASETMKRARDDVDGCSGSGSRDARGHQSNAVVGSTSRGADSTASGSPKDTATNRDRQGQPATDKDSRAGLSSVFLTSPFTKKTTRAPKAAVQGACRSVQVGCQARWAWCRRPPCWVHMVQFPPHSQCVIVYVWKNTPTLIVIQE